MHNKLTCYIQAIEICTPGIRNWQAAKQIFNQEQTYLMTEDGFPIANSLAPRERRRASATVNLSLHIAENLQQQADIDAKLLRSVFASSDGDADIFHYLSDTLSQAQPAISPTLFHQSLHNSAAGYWHIANNSQQPSLSLSANKDTFSAGLLTAVLETCTADLPVLFVAYNVMSPPPMDLLNPNVTWFGMGFILTQNKQSASIAEITCSLVDKKPETILFSEALNHLRLGNSIARSLPLLHHLAKQNSNCLYLDYFAKHSLELQIKGVS